MLRENSTSSIPSASGQLAELPCVPYCRIPIRFATRSSVSSAWSSCARVCSLVRIARIRALPSGTVGNAIPVAITPSSNSARENSIAVAALAHNDRRNRRLRGRRVHAADVESRALQLALKIPRVLPQPLDPLRLLLQNVEGRDARSRHRRRMRRGKQKRPRAMVEVVNQILRPANIAAQRANGLRQRAHLHIHLAVHAEVIHRSRARCAPARPRHARRPPS